MATVGGNVSDPSRLLGSSRDGMTRALLASGTVTDPSDAQCDALFAALARRVPELAVAGAAGAAAAAGAGGNAAAAGQAVAKTALAKVATSKAIGLGLIAKGAIVVGVAGSLAGVGVAARWAATRDAAPAPVPVAVATTAARPVAIPARASSAPAEVATTAPSASAASALVPVVPVPSVPIASLPDEPAARSSVPAAPRRAHPSAGPASAPVAPASAKAAPASEESPSPLHAESASLLQTRQMVRSGDCTGALARLQEETSRFPKGVLAQEREVLTIEALACSGRSAAATERAEAFLRAYPASPHATTLRRFTR